MNSFRVFWCALLFIFLGAMFIPFIRFEVSPTATAQQPAQQLIEDVNFEGNRRLRDEDLLYYVQTRPGDVMNMTQLERDLQALLALNFFDKTETRVSTEPGQRGGVNVIFSVSELKIIRDLQFEGLKAVTESDVLKQFREQRIGISKEATFDPVKTRNANRLIRELLSAKGFPNATIEVAEEEVSATSVAVTFKVEQGERSRIADLDFTGNNAFKDGELRGQLQLTKETGLITRFQGTDILDRGKLQYDIGKNLLPYVQSKGYLNARFGEANVEGLGRRRTGFFLPLPFISSKDDALKVTIPINEGRLYRIGKINIEGNSIFSAEQIQLLIGLKQGDVANGKQLREALYENLKKLYGTQGFIQYEAEVEPDFKDNQANANEGIADFTIRINEGKQFTLRRLEFVGNTFTRDNVLRREFLINEGDIYNQQAYEVSTVRLNQTGYFDPIDKDKDGQFRADDDSGFVDLILNVKERGRQQISFNGGVGGIGGSFFGLEYSTNNLLGRGEVLAVNAGFGNRQRNLQLSFTEPYFRDRPISVGFSVFAYSRQFFGQGTALSQDPNVVGDAFSQTGLFTTDDRNLFTNDTYGASVFASAPLSEFLRKRRFSQFSRIGLSYQYSTSQIKDPPANQDAPGTIPILFRQPNISTSRITGTFVYDSRNYSGNGIDPVSGSQIQLSLPIAGLGGDVRTYSPNVQYISFTPVRRKRSRNPEVFGFRILAGTLGSIGQTSSVRDANSFSFINGVPLYERYYLGSEFDLRGYNTRAITPFTPIDTFITSSNVVVATNNVNAGAAAPITGDAAQNARLAQIARLGAFTGASGSNPARIGQTQYFQTGADTQLLGNFEYRIPIFGPASIAAFADIGTAFNLRQGSTQVINSEPLADNLFAALNGQSLTSIALASEQGRIYQPSSNFGLILVPNDTRLLTRAEFRNLPIDSIQPNGVPRGLQEIFLRGDAQTNQLVRVGDSIFDSLKDIRSSVGVELRVQVPVVNVPFRLIYFYNPNVRRGTFGEGSGITFNDINEKRNGLRFSVGRTF